MLISEIRKEIYEFNRDVILAAKATPSKKISAETLMKFLENRIKQRDTLIEKLKLKNESMRKKRHKLTAELKEVTFPSKSYKLMFRTINSDNLFFYVDLERGAW